MKEQRYVENKYDIANENFNEIKQNIKLQANNLETILNSKFPANAKKRIDSNGTKKINFSMYTGTGGNIYLYWRKYVNDKTQPNLQLFETAYQTNLEILQAKGGIQDCNSFFMSQAGIFTMGCILYDIKKDDLNFNDNLKKLIQLKKVSENINSDDELLYGTAGYLYSLLLVRTQCSLAQSNKQLNEILIIVAKILIEHGEIYKEKYKFDTLVYPFPKEGNSSLYLGAAHGIIGVLYEILNVMKIFPDQFSKKNYEVVETSLNKVASLQFDSGNFPSSVDYQGKDNKVHFCHGSIGAIHLFILASEIFKNKKYSEIAIKAGEPLWKRGLLLKGNGVCHGIAGECYGLYKLYEYTKDEIYLKKCYLMAKGTYDPYVQDKVKVYSDPQRKNVGIPDTPFSLMEGCGGTLTMYYDLLGGNMKFPGYEIY